MYISLSVLTLALIGIPCRRPAPGTIEEEALATLTVASRSIVTALAAQLPIGIGGALGGVAIAFAATANGEVRHGVVQSRRGDRTGHWGGGAIDVVVAQLDTVFARSQIRSGGAVGIGIDGGDEGIRLGCGRLLQAMEYDAYIGGSDPILQHGRCVQIPGGGTTLQGAECDAGCTRSSGWCTAAWLLLVVLGHGVATGSPIDATALGAVVLEGLPAMAMIGALEDHQGVGAWGAWTELQTHIGQLVFLAQREG